MKIDDVTVAKLLSDLARLRAHEAVRGCVYGYARALDRLDRGLLESQFWADAQIDYGAFYRGPVSGFFDVTMRFQGAMRETQHLVGNVNIQVDGTRACAESYVHAHHILVERDSLVQLVVGARYLDQFEERDSEWRVIFRTEVMDWGRKLPISENWFEQSSELPKGQRGSGDLSYRYFVS